MLLLPASAPSRLRQRQRQSETSDDYLGVVAQLLPNVRVIVCAGNHQWVLQKRKKGGGQWPWKAVGYCRTRKALTRLSAALCGREQPSAEAMLTLESLPDNFPAWTASDQILTA